VILRLVWENREILESNNNWLIMCSDFRVLEVHTMGSTSVAGKGKGSGGAYGSRAPITARKGCEDGDKGLMGRSLRGGGCKVRMA
jgi:hypothetical protein